MTHSLARPDFTLKSALYDHFSNFLLKLNLFIKAQTFAGCSKPPAYRRSKKATRTRYHKRHCYVIPISHSQFLCEIAVACDTQIIVKQLLLDRTSKTPT